MLALVQARRLLMASAMRFVALSLSVLVAACAAAAAPEEEPDEPGTIGDGKADGTACATQIHGMTVHVCNFHEVSPGIYRGARPSAQGMRDLAALGVRTDIDLEKPAALVATERQYAAQTGIAFAPEPMSYLFEPSDALVDEILSIMADPAQQPVFLHCKLGNDRTGLIVALYRVFDEGWDPADAWQEMMDLGFHRIWVGLSHYFEEVTGYEG